MGVLKRPDGELSVEFYDDPRQTFQPGLVSVTYTARHGDISRVASDFAQYVAKVLYCLGPGIAARRLRAVLKRALAQGLTKSTDVMSGDGYSLEWSVGTSRPTKRCRAKFYEGRDPVTKFSLVGEDYYAPMSCIAFLQHLIDNLGEAELAEFSRALGSSPWESP